VTSAPTGRQTTAGILRRLAGGAVALGVAASALVVAPAVTAAGPAAAATRCSSTPFRSEPARKTWFRIPAVVRTRAGTLVAFAERRDRVTGDDGDFDVVTARSTNGGCSWSAYRVIGADAGNRVSNPTPIVDRTTGKILLFSVVAQRAGSGGKGRGLYLQTSSDDGRTFTPLLQRPIRPAGAYKGGLTGPGHGIQLSVRHPGRLVLPMGYKTPAGRYGAYGIYSDDHGATWRTGFDEQDTSGRVQLIEGTVAELPTGDLFISFRDKWDGAAVGAARRYAISKDGGTTLAAPFRRQPMNVVSVQGSALALKGTYANHLLFSAPADPTPNLRREMSVFVSTTRGATWGRRYQVELEDTPGSYSDLVQLSPSTIGVLYETGTVTWKERIAFETIAVPSLLNPARVASRVTYQRSANPTRTSSQAAVTVTVRVGGIASPPGRVTLAYAGARSGRVAVDLTYSNRGLRVLRLPKLPRGDYRLTLTYSGTGRIAPATVPAGTLRVVP
jgi:sialidase-1